MKTLKVLGLIICATSLASGAKAENAKDENAWADPVAPKVEAQAPAKKKKPKPKPAAQADAHSPSSREPASAPDANKVLPSPLQLPTAVATPPPSASITIPGKLTFSGFANFRYTAFSAPYDSGVPNAHAESGFGIEDGALNAVYDIDKVSFTADIAVRRFKDGEFTSATGTITNQSQTDRLHVGADPSELYVKYKADDHWTFDLGQYFGIIGAESGQSRSRTFTKSALLSGLLPSVQTGFMTEYANSGWSAKVEAANPNNKGTYGTSATGDENTEYTAAAGYSNETFQSQLSYMTRPINAVDGTRSDRTLMDVTIGATLGAFSLGAEVTRIDDPSKNTLTGASDHENAGFAYLALVNYKLNDKDLLGLRYEKLTDDPGGTSLKSADSYGLSVHHRLHQNVDLSAEYNIYDYQNVAGSTWRNGLFSIGAILSF